MISSLPEARRVLWKYGSLTVLICWLVQFTELSISSFMEGGARNSAMLLPRAIVLVLGIPLTLLIVEVSARSASSPLRKQITVTVAAALVTYLTLIVINYAVFVYFITEKVTIAEYITTAFSWSWFFLAVAGALIAITHSLKIRDRERRLAVMETVASEARMAALRYQLNPHFLFNTLNSIAALIDAKENVQAEEMVEGLADFLRATLELDPLVDIPLAKELELQALYLSIEETRFPTRLRTSFGELGDLGRALVPPLIIQPLVENAIRHAVARSKGAVLLRIDARSRSDRLLITVENEGQLPDVPPRPGTGVGIANVRARLEARFGADQLLTARPTSSGYRVDIEMPLRRVPQA